MVTDVIYSMSRLPIDRRRVEVDDVPASPMTGRCDNSRKVLANGSFSLDFDSEFRRWVPR